MDGMGVWMNNCITWYDDTKTENYTNGYINFKSDQNGCWSYIGQQSSIGPQGRAFHFEEKK